jgi:hypothetical protein
MVSGRLLLAAASAIAALSCSSSSGSSGAPSSDDAGDDGALPAATVVHTYKPTYTAIFNEILQPTCALVFCHASDGSNFLLMTTKAATYTAMVNVTSRGPKCGQTGLKIVDPGNPGSSLLYQKVTAPTCGVQMPDGFPPLDMNETEQIRLWIANNAPND